MTRQDQELTHYDEADALGKTKATKGKHSIFCNKLLMQFRPIGPLKNKFFRLINKK